MDIGNAISSPIDDYFMRIALSEAQQAAAENEVPVGAAIEIRGQLLAQNHNRMIQWKDATAHAELLVMQEAARRHKDRWLLECTLYVTLEPCVMCAGALVLSRVPRLVYATHDPKAGGCGSVYDLTNSPKLNHRVGVVTGILRDESTQLMQAFFTQLKHKGTK